MQLVFPPNDAVVFPQIMSATALIYMQHVFPLNDAVNVVFAPIMLVSALIYIYMQHVFPLNGPEGRPGSSDISPLSGI